MKWKSGEMECGSKKVVKWKNGEVECGSGKVVKWSVVVEKW